MTLRRTASWLLLAVLLGGCSAHAQDRFPRFTAPVVDAAGVVPDETEERVNAALLDYQRRTDNQIAVALVKTLGEATIEDYSEDLFDAWGVGEKGKDNGALLVIAMEERRIRIEVGFGLEGDLTDLESGRIIREHISPRMTAGDVGAAVQTGTIEIRRALGDPDAEAQPVAAPEERDDDRSWSPLVFGLIPFIFILSSLRRRGRRRRRWDLAPIFWGGGLGGTTGGGLGGSGGGFGGGGFGGGGGGGSGGGGASGGW